MQFLAVLALVQMPWTNTLPERGVALDFLRPKFDVGGTSLTSGAAYLSGRIPTGGGFSLRVEVPYAHLGVSGGTSSTFGNPYLGIETTSERVTIELGFRPALTSDNEFAAAIGYYSDITRIEAFTPHLATLSGRLTYRGQSSTGMTVEAGAGPSAWIPTEGGDKEIILHHYGSVGYRSPKIWTAFGLGGILIMTENLDFGERTFYQLGGSIGLTGGTVRPALHFILPLDDAITSDVDYIIGLGVGIEIK